MSINENSFTQTTQSTLIELHYEWTITHFSFRPEPLGTALKSAQFAAKEDANVVWQLWLYPNGRESAEHAGLFLNLIRDNNARVPAKYRFAIVNPAKQEVKSWDFRVSIFKANDINSSWGFPKVADLMNDNRGYLTNDTLIIRCEVRYTNGQREVFNRLPITVSDCQMTADVARLFESGKLSDCTLQAGKVSFKVHKAILASRSDVFAAMFEHNMQEQQQGIIKIDDLDPKVVRELLYFIYSGSAPKLTELASSLLPAADKYQLKRLKQLCEVELYKRLSVDNVCDTLILADEHNCDELQAHAEHFVMKEYDILLRQVNKDSITSTKGWKELIGGHLQLFISAAFKALDMKTYQQS